MIPRRSFLRGSVALAAFGDVAFLSRLPRVAAAETVLEPRMVRFNPDIEPMVRLLEETPRERVIEEVAHRVKHGLTYREVLAALLLAGVRNIQPRPVGFKFHAVLVVNSAHLASLASQDSDRWLPIFWGIDQFKASQAADASEGDWTMAPVDEAAVPPGDRAKKAFIEAMDNWDEAAADAAVAGLARSAAAEEIFEIFARYGVRDFRDIGHKAIYVANSFRTLEVIGWQHAEPVLRSLAYALLELEGAKQNPARADLPADRPFRQNVGKLREVRDGWQNGTGSAEAGLELLQAMRTGSASELSDLTVKLLNRGHGPQPIFDALLNGAGELLMQRPGIVSLHAMTFTNAVHYAWQRVRNDETRRLLLLQNAAFLPLFRGDHKDTGVHIDGLEPLAPANGDGAIDEILAEMGGDRLAAARKVLGHLKDHPNPQPFADAARRLIFQKGTNSHDYKFSSAVLEDYRTLASPWRERLLAASVFNLRSSRDRDNGLVQRIRSALAA